MLLCWHLLFVYISCLLLYFSKKIYYVFNFNVMADETINLDRGEVLAHLKHILGHDIEITEEQLTIFIHDLRKLIRKDQKEKEPIPDDCTCNCHETWHSRTSDNDTESVVESQSERKSIPLKPASSCKFNSKFGSSCLILWVSVIRPWNIRHAGKKAPSRNLKEDPVKLHQHYQNAWRQYRFPGESGHSDLRWNIREKMMGQGPTPRVSAGTILFLNPFLLKFFVVRTMGPSCVIAHVVKRSQKLNWTALLRSKSAVLKLK